MSWLHGIAQLIVLLCMPVVVSGLLNRVKSWWSGRKGPPILQLAYDLQRLLRKSPVYSDTTTPVFRTAPYLFLATTLASGLIAPVLGTTSVLSFAFDFVWFAYVWGLGRVVIMLAAFDVGSSFQGMGAAREALFSAAVEPALFLVAGALAFLGGERTLSEITALELRTGGSVVAWVAALVALMILVQVETSRLPADDPATHLELTMVHEVMVLDHSGPELAAIQLASATKLFVGCSLIATLLNPLARSGGVAASALNLALCAGVAMFQGCVESLVARLRLRSVPQYVAVALVCGGVALLAAIWRVGPAR